jgi:hypothetical protein
MTPKENNETDTSRNACAELINTFNNMPFRTIDEFLKYAHENNLKIDNYKIDDRLTKDYGNTGKIITAYFDLYKDNFKVSISARGFDKLANIHIGGWSDITHGYVCFSEI